MSLHFFGRSSTYKKKTIRQVLSLLFAGVFVAITSPIQAAITITPVIVHVPPDGRAIITVRNDRQREVMYQITVFRWVQVDGVDRYEATQDFIASPPLFTLAANDSQIIRMGFRNPVRLPVEQSYRLILAEVPREARDTDESGVVEFAMQYAIPVFVASSNRAGLLSLVWQIREEGGALVVRADNPSSTHTVLNMVGLTRESGANPKPELASPQRATVLAHAWREWRFSVAHDKLHLPWRIVLLQNDRQTVEVVPDADVRANPR